MNVPFIALFPTITQFCGVDQDAVAREPGGWVLQRLGQAPFKMNSTPSAEGLYDGELIYLRGKSVEMPAMASDDIADEVASIHDGPGRWSPADAQHLSVGAAAIGLFAGAILLTRPDHGWLYPALVAGLMFLVMLAGAVIVSRAWGNGVVAILLGCAALPYGFMAGVDAIAHVQHHDSIPVILGAGSSLGTLCGFALVVFGAIIGLVGVATGAPVFFGLTLAGILGAGAAVIDIAFPAAAPAGAGALVTIPALALTPFLPGIVFGFARLKMPRVPASADDLRNDAMLSPQPDVKERAVVADHLLTGAIAGIGLTGIGAEAALGTGHGWLVAVTMAVLACALLLHSRTFNGRLQRLWLFVPGYLGIGWLAIVFGHIFTALALLAGAAVVAGVGSWLPGHRPNPVWGRLADILDILLVIAMVPLALYVAGVLDFVRGTIGG